jgi:hypothetical protein
MFTHLDQFTSQRRRISGKNLQKCRRHDLPHLIEIHGTGFPENIAKDMIMWQCNCDKIIHNTISLSKLKIAS